MIYPKSQEASLSSELFRNPGAEYRGAPFWAWNNKLDADQLTRQIDYFEEMGIGGFHMHVRTGMDTPYMSEEFLKIVGACVEKAKKKGMKAYLYDEDRWPSGAAGGLVTKNPEYRTRYLLFTPDSYEDLATEGVTPESSGRNWRQGNGKLLARYAVTLKDGFLESYRMLSEGENADCTWYLYLETPAESPWYNNQTYVDTLNRKAIEAFIASTHEPYYKAFGEDFGGVIPAIFTDEPQFSHKTTLGFAGERADVILPYTDTFEELYREAYGESFLAHMPEVIWELPGEKLSLTRYRYHDRIAELFASAFADTIGDWCAAHGIQLTGHMMEEPTLQSQTAALGDCMRSYRSFHMPGIDMLCDRREYTTAKQAQSAVHQYGREGVLSELYGVTNWTYDFRGHKLQGDWQAALGVTNRVHHLSWVSMQGEAKRDYPASIFYQSPWYKEYKYIEDHFARVNTALTRGKARVKVGVIHPVESYWLHFGPKEQTQMIRAELEENFDNITNWLLFSHIDFDFISESLLPDQFGGVESGFKVGEMAYDAVLVPGCETLRSSTLERLEKFSEAGGKVLFVGEAPRYIDAIPSSKGRELADRCVTVPFQKTRVIAALEPYRDVDFRRADGSVAGHLLYQMREDGDMRWLFAANGKTEQNKDVPTREEITLTVKGCWSVEFYDSLTGDIHSLPVKHVNGDTIVSRSLYDHDSLLLRLAPSQAQAATLLPGGESAYERLSALKGPVAYSLSEPNVLLLDQAEYRFDGGQWHPREELLLADNAFRDILGYPPRRNAVAQPWTENDVQKAEHCLSLRFTITSQIDIAEPVLALECPESTKITLNGEAVPSKSTGYFVDESIETVKLSGIPAGTSILELEIPFTRKTNVEWCYLLGDFGVEVAGDSAVLTKLPEMLHFSDYTRQGLPFYAGNVTYHLDLESDGGEYALEISKYRSPLMSVNVDGKLAGKLVFAPYRLDLGCLEKGVHKIDITSFGNRANSFGAIHNCDENVSWHGPDAWRSVNERFSYEYQLWRMGILKAPELLRKK